MILFVVIEQQIHINSFSLGEGSVEATHRDTAVASLRASLLAQPGVSLITLTGERSAAFAGMQTFKDSGGATPPVHTGTPRPPTDCPFVNEESAVRSAWDALESEPSTDMYAFNLIRIPEPELYTT